MGVRDVRLANMQQRHLNGSAYRVDIDTLCTAFTFSLPFLISAVKILTLHVSINVGAVFTFSRKIHKMYARKLEELPTYTQKTRRLHGFAPTYDVPVKAVKKFRPKLF